MVPQRVYMVVLPFHFDTERCGGDNSYPNTFNCAHNSSIVDRVWVNFSDRADRLKLLCDFGFLPFDFNLERITIEEALSSPEEEGLAPT